MPGPAVTVVIPTLDEADRIGPCLESVRWANQILVIDSGSTDGTAEIARRLGAEVVIRPFTGYGDQRNHGAALARHDWILCLDADERVSPALQAEIAAVLAAAPAAAGFRLRRETEVAGRIIRHCGWQRDRVVRLYDRRRGRWNQRAVHERVELDGDCADLVAPLQHATYRNLFDFAAKGRRYAELGAVELHRSGRRAGPLSILLLPPARFLKMYVLERGFLDGVPGLVVCGLAAYGVFLKYVRLWELRLPPQIDRKETANATESGTARDSRLPAL